MNVLIVEDEKHAAERLRDQLHSIDPAIKIEAMIQSVDEAVRYLHDHAPELIFLDIQLSDGLCFDIFDRVSVTCPIIFTTAYDQYAIEAFKLYSIAYLLKPIKKDEVAAALLKYHKMQRLLRGDIDLLASHVLGNRQYKKRFLIQLGDRIKTIDVGEIAYFFAREKAVYMVLFPGRNIPVEYTLDKLETLLNPADFFRINRKFMISMGSIESMSSYSRKRVKVALNPPYTGGSTMDTLVSIEKASAFRNWLDA